MDVTIRPAVAADVESCGRIIYEAFKGIADRHGFPPHFSNMEVAIQRAAFCLRHPSIFAVIAESDGRIIGSNFLDERDPIRGLGPVTVDPHVQVRGVGRRLMEAVLERARGAVGVRLVQDSFNMLSISLYASLGFEAKEPLLLMRGKPKGKPPSGVEVRPLKPQDVGECAALCTKVHGLERLNELQDALETLSPLIALREGRVTALWLGAYYVAAESRCGRHGRRYESAAAGCCGHEFGAVVLLVAREARKSFPLVFERGFPSSHTDDADGDGQVSGS